jgi:cell division protein FtsW
MFLIDRFRRKKGDVRSRSRQKSSVIKREKVNKEISKSDRPGLFYRIHGRPDFNLIVLIILMLLGGVLMIFSASSYYAYTEYNDAFYYFQRQLIWIALGSIGAYIVYLTPMKFIKKISPIMLLGGILILLYIVPEALFGHTFTNAEGDIVTSGIQMPLVEALNGATRWLNLGITYLQPSEFVKFALIIYMATWLIKEKKKEITLQDHVQTTIIPFLVVLGAVSSLILIQRDFDTTVVLVLAIMSVYYVSGKDRKHSLGTMAILVFAIIFGFIAMNLEEYRRARVETFAHIAIYGKPSEGDALEGAFQVYNGLIGFGSGGVFGNGYGNSVIKQGYLQEAAYTDSIYAVIGDEFGLMGSIVVIIGFLHFANLGFNIAKKSKDKFQALTAVGVTSLITIQGLLNIGAVLVVIPFGGMPLPFFTYGGSITIITLSAVGLLLNISKENNRQAISLRGRRLD